MIKIDRGGWRDEFPTTKTTTESGGLGSLFWDEES